MAKNNRLSVNEMLRQLDLEDKETESSDEDTEDDYDTDNQEIIFNTVPNSEHKRFNNASPRNKMAATSGLETQCCLIFQDGGRVVVVFHVRDLFNLRLCTQRSPCFQDRGLYFQFLEQQELTENIEPFVLHSM